MFAAGSVVVVDAASPYRGERGTVVEVGERQAKVRIIGVGDRKFRLGDLKHPGRAFRAWIKDAPEYPVYVITDTVEEAANRAFWSLIGDDVEGEDFDVGLIIEDENGVKTGRHVSVRWKWVADIEIEPLQD